MQLLLALVHLHNAAAARVKNLEPVSILYSQKSINLGGSVRLFVLIKHGRRRERATDKAAGGVCVHTGCWFKNCAFGYRGKLCWRYRVD